MKKRILFRIAPLALIVLVAAAFSSCRVDDNDYTKRASLVVTTLNDPVQPQTDRNGNFSVTFYLDQSMISSLEPHERLLSISLYEGWIDIIGNDFRTGDYIDMVVNADRVSGFYRALVPVNVRNGVATVDTSDINFHGYMSDVLRSINNAGNCYLNISGTIYDVRGARVSNLGFDVTTDLRLDIRVR